VACGEPEVRGNGLRIFNKNNQKLIDMKKLFFLFSVIVILTACERKYKYVEIVREQSIIGGSSIKEKDEKILSASSDSAAYIEAFSNFCIAQKAYSDMRKKGMAIIWIFLLASNYIIPKE
jgi:hypothetical protein